MSIETLHTELDYDTWEPVLRDTGGIWTLLQSLRKRATNPAGVTAYRAYLERCLNQIKVHDVELQTLECDAVLNAWSQLTKQRNKELKEQIYSRNPLGVENWMHRWQPLVYDDYRLALNAWLTRATHRSGDRLLDTTRTLFDQFEKAISCESEKSMAFPSPKPIDSVSL